jgi:hypothetical protein
VNCPTCGVAGYNPTAANNPNKQLNAEVAGATNSANQLKRLAPRRVRPQDMSKGSISRGGRLASN